MNQDNIRNVSKPELGRATGAEGILTDVANLPSWQRGGSNANEQLQLLTSYGLRAELLAGYNEAGIANLVRSGRGVIVVVDRNNGWRWQDSDWRVVA